jgi:hypothetical protein
MAKGTGKFGWCLTDQHDNCRIVLTVLDRKCTCECHVTQQNTDSNV